MVLCIGLTGSIASGKSRAADFFKKQGIQVINADHIAKNLTQKNQPALTHILDHMGPNFLTPSGELNRRTLRQYIMNNPSERRWLEEYLHPLIRNEIELQIRTIKSPYVILEIPLLTNKQPYPYLNRVLLIEADEKKQIQRIMTRDQCTEEEALALLRAQPDQALRRAIADDLIQNDGSVADLEKKCFERHVFYLKTASVPDR